MLVCRRSIPAFVTSLPERRAERNFGGILANDTRLAQFLYDNLAIESNVIEAANVATRALIMPLPQ
jgi:hypothetical protein